MSEHQDHPVAPSAVILDDFGDGPELAVSRCPKCGEHRYPPPALCVAEPTPMQRVPASREGALAVAVHVHRPPQGFSRDFWLGYVDLPQGVRILAQVEPG